MIECQESNCFTIMTVERRAVKKLAKHAMLNLVKTKILCVTCRVHDYSFGSRTNI